LEEEEIFEHIEKNRDKYIKWLTDICSIPSVAAQNRGMKESVDFISKLFKDELDCEVEVVETSGYPILYCEIGGEHEKTLSFYNHYDVQPENPIELWDSDPFKPEIRDGKIFARGVADNKGNLIARIAALSAIKDIYGNFPINLKFIIEGEEEIGSINLSDFSNLHKDKLKADACIWEFGYRDMDHTLQLTLGVKGMLYVELKLKGANTDLHSANASIIENPAWRLVWALNSLKNNNEEVLIPNFYKDIREPTNEELELLDQYFLDEEEMLDYLGLDKFINDLNGSELKHKHLYEPTMNICGFGSGYTDEGAKTVLPSEASVKIDFRLVPGQDPEKILKDLRNHLNDNGYKDIEIISHSKEKAARTLSTEEIVGSAIEAIKKVTKKEPNIVPNTPGTGPMYELCQKHGIPSVSFGVGNFSSRNHAPNENILVEDYIEGIKILVSLINQYKN